MARELATMLLFGSRVLEMPAGAAQDKLINKALDTGDRIDQLADERRKAQRLMRVEIKAREIHAALAKVTPEQLATFLAECNHGRGTRNSRYEFRDDED